MSPDPGEALVYEHPLTGVQGGSQVADSYRTFLHLASWARAARWVFDIFSRHTDDPDELSRVLQIGRDACQKPPTRRGGGLPAGGRSVRCNKSPF